MTNSSDDGRLRRLYLVSHAGLPERPKTPIDGVNITIFGEVAMGLFVHYLSQGGTAADVVAALASTVTAMETDAGAELDVTVRRWDKTGYPLITAAMGTPTQPEPPPTPRCG